MKAIVSFTCLLLLAACGESKFDRGASGAAIGAGAAAGAVTGQGAVKGGLLGGAAGVLTDEDDVDLGTPVWKR